jgi:DSF synthase
MIREPLYDLAHYSMLEVSADPAHGVVWQRMKPAGRPCYSMELLRQMRQHDASLQASGGVVLAEGDIFQARYVVYGSAIPGVFNLGGDLGAFIDFCERKDRVTLKAYADACIETLWNRLQNLGLPITTISLVEGRAFGGGFENAISSSVILAERDAQFSFPEVSFSLFPGMGAYSILKRRIGHAETMRMIMSGDRYSAAELHERGVIDALFDRGEGRKAVYEFIRRHGRHHNTAVSMQQVERLVDPITRRELDDVVDVWCDSILRLGERDLKVMRSYRDMQERMWNALQAGTSSDNRAARPLGHATLNPREAALA